MTTQTSSRLPALTTTLRTLYENRHQSNSVLHQGMASVELMLSEHPLFAKFSQFQNGECNSSASSLEIRLEVPLTISPAYGFEMRIDFEMDATDTRVEVWTNYLAFNDLLGDDSIDCEPLAESETEIFRLDEYPDLGAELENVIRRQIQFMADQLTAFGERVYGKTSDKFLNVHREMALERVVPPAFADFA